LGCISWTPEIVLGQSTTLAGKRIQQGLATNSKQIQNGFLNNLSLNAYFCVQWYLNNKFIFQLTVDYSPKRSGLSE
jgi:hypothetical protein